MNQNPIPTYIRRTAILVVFIALFFSVLGSPATSTAIAQEATPTDEVTSQTGEADLIPTEIMLSPPDTTISPNFYENDDIQIRLLVAYNGAAASGSFYINFYVDLANAPPVASTACGNSEWKYQVQSPSLPASETNTWYVVIPAGTLTANDYKVTVFVDSNCDVDESDDANNVMSESFTVLPPPVNPPLNDNFAAAIDLSSESLPYTTGVLDIRGATREASDPSELDCKPTSDPLDAGLASVWYSYTPSGDQNLVLDAIGSNFDTYIAVWKDGTPLQFVDCNDDEDTSGESLQSVLPVKVLAGETYYFEIAQFIANRTSDGVTAQAGGNLVFNISEGIEISGNVALPGVTLSYVDGFPKTVVSNSSGDYFITVRSGWEGTVTPSMAGSSFSPASREYSNVTEDQTNQDYALGTTFLSIASQDGWILESSETSNKGGKLNKGATTLRVGDNAANKQFRSILSFDTSVIPSNATITAVTLRFKHAGVAGTTPFKTHGKLLVDMRFGPFSNNIALQKGDFQAAANQKKALIYTKATVEGWYTRLLSADYYELINRDGVTQFRLRFSKDDNNDFGADFLKIYSGDADEANRPQLIIEYSIEN
jgi:hypothetical protein